jgi:hypothetical protein
MTANQPPETRRPYQTPRLVRLGSVEQLTQMPKSPGLGETAFVKCVAPVSTC